MADVTAKIIKLALNGKLSQSAIKELARESRYTAQHVRRLVRETIRAGYITKFVVTDAGLEYLQRSEEDEY